LTKVVGYLTLRDQGNVNGSRHLHSSFVLQFQCSALPGIEPTTSHAGHGVLTTDEPSGTEEGGLFF